MKNAEPLHTNDLSENELRSILKSALSGVPKNPWFTYTLLRRLPPKRQRIAARIEILTSTIALVITIVCGVRFVSTSLSSPALTVRHILIYAMYLTLFGTLLLNITWPIIAGIRFGKE